MGDLKMSPTSSKRFRAVFALGLIALAATGLSACHRRQPAAAPEEAEPAEEDKPAEEPVQPTLPVQPMTIPSMTPAPPSVPLSVPSFGSGRVLRGGADLGSIERVGGPGVVDVGAVARLVRGQLGGLRACYERELRNNPALAGRLDVSFTIGTSGRITGAFATGLAPAPTVGACVIGRVRNLVFPVSQGGEAVFRQPITFSPGS